jgi:ABC-type bacteriocin/lantibiotic exporter with double-glycine peptidase domain
MRGARATTRRARTVRRARAALALVLTLLAGREAAHALRQKPWQTEKGWIAVPDVQFRSQRAEHDCGPTALHMILDHFCAGEPANAATAFGADRRVTAGELRNRARTLGFDAFVISGTFQDIEHELRRNRPVIVGVAKPAREGKAIAHYEVVIGIAPKDNRIVTLDPAAGWRELTFAGFLEQWTPTKHLLLVLLPTQRADPCSARGAANTGASVTNSELTFATVHSAFSRRSGR